MGKSRGNSALISWNFSFLFKARDADSDASEQRSVGKGAQPAVPRSGDGIQVRSQVACSSNTCVVEISPQKAKRVP